MCILCVYMLLKVVHYFGLSVPSMSVMSFKRTCGYEEWFRYY